MGSPARKEIQIPTEEQKKYNKIRILSDAAIIIAVLSSVMHIAINRYLASDIGDTIERNRKWVAVADQFAQLEYRIRDLQDAERINLTALGEALGQVNGVLTTAEKILMDPRIKKNSVQLLRQIQLVDSEIKILVEKTQNKQKFNYTRLKASVADMNSSLGLIQRLLIINQHATTKKYYGIELLIALVIFGLAFGLLIVRRRALEPTKMPRYHSHHNE